MILPENQLPQRTPMQLLAAAREGLAEAAQAEPDGLRYAAAHLAALRAAAAVLAARATPGPKGQPVRSVWDLLPEVAPELSEWAWWFDSLAVTRAAVEAGIPNQVTARDADRLVDAAGEFVTAVEGVLGVAR